MDIKQKVGQRIKQLREAAGITQLVLSQKSDLDRTYITSVENGKRNISIVNLQKIARSFNLSLAEFFKDI